MHAILGGTFDPPHVGHLAAASTAIEQLDIDVVRFAPAGDPWQKADTGVSHATHRLAMTRLVAAEDARFTVDEVEIRRTGPTYTIDTVEAIDGRCVLVLGADAALGLPTWHRSAELLGMVDIAVVPRPGAEIDRVEGVLGRSVTVLSMPSIDISSTAIRSHVGAGHSARFFVTDPVWEYIAAHRLYR